MDDERRRRLIMELAAVVDAGKPFVTLTYRLEDDRLLVFNAAELAYCCHSKSLPICGRPSETALRDFAREIPSQVNRPIRRTVLGIQYFLQKFNN